jgi:CheY-like chemotaxis protein
LRGLTRACLESNNYVVRDAPDAATGFLAEKLSGPTHLLLTDIVMPGTFGCELAKHLVVLHPEIRVLYMSGYGHHLTGQGSVLDENTALLEKPLTLHTLLTKVHPVDSHGTRRRTPADQLRKSAGLQARELPCRFHVAPESYSVAGFGRAARPRDWRITAKSSALSTGFCRKASAPASSERAWLGPTSLAETTMIGTTDRDGKALSLSITMKPPPAGRPRSKITRSGLQVRASAIAVKASAAKKVS